MSAEQNPLDLNNFPEDYTREGKQVFEDNSSSSSGYRRKKSSSKDGKEECGKVYECRFCSLKFCKSQALGGHMNRHRQERETEALNHARQLVYSNDNPAATHGGLHHHHHHLGCHPMAPGSYHHPPSNNISDPFRSTYNQQPRLLSSSSSSSTATLFPPPQHQPQPYLYNSPPRPLSPYSPQFPHKQQPHNDYYIGHVLHHHHPNYNNLGATETNYTCIGAPVGPAGFGLPPGGTPRGIEGMGRDGSHGNNHHLDQDGHNWGLS